MTACTYKTRSRKLTLLTVAAALAGAFASATVLAGEPVATDDAKARYLKERANCEAGNTTQDKATCLKEAGAALDEKKKGKLDNSGSPVANATDRCNVAAGQGQGRLPGAHRRPAEPEPARHHLRQRRRRRRDPRNHDHHPGRRDHHHAGPAVPTPAPAPASAP